MTRDDERRARSNEAPIVGGLPDFPGILVAMNLAPGLAVHLRGLADELLVKDFPGATITRGERELLATAVSAANDCFYCMDTHGAFACAVAPELSPLLDDVKAGGARGVSAKLAALLAIARTVAKHGRQLTGAEVQSARDAGASDADTQLAVLIAAGFAMYNRMVDGLRAKTPSSVDAYAARAEQIAAHGYSDARINAVPR
ncbi:MAG TPA: carboxymuconolactone decarboxylase family protein [Myxococcota bacterium]